MTARALLLANVALFEQPTAHTTGATARDMSGTPVAATSPEASCWCTLGGLLKGAGTGTLDHPDVHTACELLQLAAVELGCISVTRCNDLQGRKGALAMNRRALELLDTEGSTV